MQIVTKRHYSCGGQYHLWIRYAWLLVLRVPLLLAWRDGKRLRLVGITLPCVSCKVISEREYQQYLEWKWEHLPHFGGDGQDHQRQDRQNLDAHTRRKGREVPVNSGHAPISPTTMTSAIPQRQTRTRGWTG